MVVATPTPVITVRHHLLAVGVPVVPVATARAAGINSMRKHFIIATRGSQLALWQANHIKNCLESLQPGLTVSLNVIKTQGDIIQDVSLAKIGGKGLFVKEIETALLEGRADLAVHSMKDVPMALPEDLILGCIPKRELDTDCFLSFKWPELSALPLGAHVGTSSLRRQAQLLSIRPDLRISPLRGNVDTRLKKLANDDYDAIILASAGLKRLGLTAPYMQHLDTQTLLPAVGQGALGIECREDLYDLLVLLSSMEDRASRVCVTAERSFLARLDGGCQVPIAGHADMLDEEHLLMRGLVADVDGSVILRAETSGYAENAEQLGKAVAEELLAKGAQQILDKLYNQE